MAKEWKHIWVIFEQYDGFVPDVNWEMLGKARELADKTKQKVAAVILGHDMDEVAQEAIHRGADIVYYADHELLKHYSWEAYIDVVSELIEKHKPNALICSATHNGRDLAGRLAVRFNTGLTADVVRIDVGKENPDILIGAVPGFGGSILAIIEIPKSKPQMFTVRPGVLLPHEPDTSRKGEIKKYTPKIDASKITTKLIKTIPVTSVDISKAERIVAGGRGIQSNFQLIEELAKILDAQVGVTRPLADAGIKPRDYQIGSTGVIVRPKVALVVGISGATHFVAGVQDADTIISINIDPEALMFEHSDYNVVGDANEILPELIAVLKEKLYAKP